MIKIKQYLFLILGLYIFLSPYFVYRYDKLIWYDAGFYVAEINRYLQYSITSLKEHIAVFHEPGWILSAMAFFQMTWLKPAPDLRLLLWFLLIAKTLVIFLISKRLVQSNTKTIVFIAILLFSNAYINSYYLFLYRQFFTDYLLIAFIYLLTKKIKPIWTFLPIYALLIAGIYISHRGISLVLLLSIIVAGFSGNWIKKLNKKSTIWILWIIILSFLLIFPYFSISFKWNKAIITEFVIKTNEANKSTYATANQGVSIYSGKQEPYGIKVWELFLKDPILSLLIIWIFWSWNKNKLIKNKILLLIIWFLYLIVATKGPFSQRIFYYLFVAIFILYTHINKQKLIKIIFLTFVMISGTQYMLSKKPLVWYYPEIQNFFEQFNKDRTLFVTFWSHGTLLDEMWWRTSSAESFWNQRFDKKINKIGVLPKDFYAKWYTNFFPVYDKETDIYIIIPYWIANTKSSQGGYNLVNTNEWDNSKYFVRIKSICKKNRVFCYIYKYIWPYQDPLSNAESSFWDDESWKEEWLAEPQ